MADYTVVRDLLTAAYGPLEHLEIVCDNARSPAHPVSLQKAFEHHHSPTHRRRHSHPYSSSSRRQRRLSNQSSSKQQQPLTLSCACCHNKTPKNRWSLPTNDRPLTPAARVTRSSNVENADAETVAAIEEEDPIDAFLLTLALPAVPMRTVSPILLKTSTTQRLPCLLQDAQCGSPPRDCMPRQPRQYQSHHGSSSSVKTTLSSKNNYCSASTTTRWMILSNIDRAMMGTAESN
jgi:hypothetical protein